MSQGVYSSKTLVGPWQQQRQIEKDRLEDFLERCRKGQLAIQGMTELYQRFTETHAQIAKVKTAVKMSTDGCVRFCDSYVFLCPPSKPQYVELGWCNERPQTMLTADYEQCLAAGDVVVRDGNGVTASTCIQPVARSVFQIF
ncbi:hypothetical protein X801_09574, partial [Opisthorchis viverrini]